MAQPQLLQIKLSRFDAQPWGFRLQGGTDFAAPLLVQKVNGGSLAEQAGLMPGDAVIKINDVDVFNLRHKDAQDIVVRSGNNFVITVQRGGSTWRPHVQPTGQMPQPNSPYLQTVTKTSLAHKQQESQHIGCGYNNAAKPFGNGVDGNVKSIVNKQYNSPVGIYSDESIAETLSAQAEVLAGGVLGVNFKKNEKEYQADKSEVLKFLREEESGPSTPEPHSTSNYYWTRSHAIGGHHKQDSDDERIGTPLQQNTLAPAATHRPSLPTPKSTANTEPPKPAVAAVPEIPDPRLIVMPVCPALQTPEYKEEMEAAAKAAALGPDGQPRPLSASGHPPCAMCGVGIVGVFVRIKDRNLHVECFKCATCGTSLKNQGYYNFNNKLYCDIHAKLAAMQNPPSGTEGYVPIPIKPNTKLSASTITSALNAHGYNNGVSNGSSTPAPVAPPLPTATTTTTTPSSSNLSFVDKSPFNNSSNSQIINDNCNTTTNEMSATTATGPSGDKPFEYVTLTGNVIRSVVPPGKGNVNYKVNQGGYARPYGAAPPAAAPKSPVSYPPQQQQWNQPPPTQPKPTGGNAYATLPRSNVGQQDRSGPVTMAFQALDEHMVRDQSQTPSRPYTPSMINKPAPITPYYQTPEKLCFDECPATHARDYDRRSASPFPDRARSPAPGPPPNPLAAIRAPRMKESEVSPLSPRVLQAGSITTGQSYLGAQQAQQQERLLSHTATGTQSAMQSFTQEPEKREKMQIGNMTVERSEKASRLEEQKQSQMQSHTTTQVGNTQIERRRKVTEEFEHTSSAKTVEIRTGSQSSSTERRQSYGKTGYVANQARRLSGLEQEITNLTSQSQAISARAATLTETKFPELHSQGGQSQFPTKPVLPSHDESQPPSYYVSGATTKKLDEPACTIFPPAQQKPSSTSYGASLVSSQQSQSQSQQQQQQLKSLTTLSTTSSSHQQKQQQQANTVSCSLTKASATTCTNNQAYQSITAGSNLNATSTSTTTSSATGTAPSGVCPVTGTFCRPGHTCCKQQQLQQSNNNGSRPTASLGSAGSKPSQAAASSNITANMQSQSSAAPSAAPTPSASKRPSVSAPSNNTNNDSATGGMAPKGGAYGATTAPKRGRGILNKAVSSGVRVPTCNSCSTHIRGPFITALGKIWCPEHFHCVNGNCRRPLQDIGFVEEKGDLYCEYCFEKYLAPTCSKCAGKIKGDCLNAIGKHFHPECFACGHCGKLFGNTPFFLEDGMPYCEADWNELFTTKCFACGFPVEAGDRWVEALNHNYHSQCFNCTYCKQNLEGQSFYNKGGRPFCKNHAR
ncbi:PDZ and LIM domain protein Zasp isoform X4 [Lucilia sericata]|uniref:PDZ and LIM domain protein Zasp isoform X4 n=1 Tax=Lucilia sericata TaxID=13632 RepID=UPI0018A837DC|nr:PDZ and LIM domain protein Zasp isoform X4 [Lucilia sericata]